MSKPATSVPYLAPILQDRLLTTDELFALTKKRRATAQAKVLRDNGIKPIIAADGSVQVTAFAVALACTPSLGVPDAASAEERALPAD